MASLPHAGSRKNVDGCAFRGVFPYPKPEWAPTLIRRRSGTKRSGKDSHYHSVGCEYVRVADNTRFTNPPRSKSGDLPIVRGIPAFPDPLALANGGQINVDAILCNLQSVIKETATVRFRALPMRLGVGRPAGSEYGRLESSTGVERLGHAVAELIKFYVPRKFQPRTVRLVRKNRGKVIEFRPREVGAVDSADGGRKFILLPVRASVMDVPGR